MKIRNLLYSLPEDLKEKIVIETTKLNMKNLLRNLPMKEISEEAKYSVVCVKTRDIIEELYIYYIFHFEDEESQIDNYNGDIDIISKNKNTFIITRNISIGFSWYELLTVYG